MTDIKEEEIKNLVIERLEKAGIKTDRCRKCQKTIVYMQTIHGNWAPMTMSLINHFADCPNAKDFRKKDEK